MFHRYIILISLRQCWEVSLNIFCFCLLPDNRSFSVLAVSTMVRNFSLLFWETVTVFYPPSRSCAGLKWHSISALLLREQNIFFAILTWKKCVCQYTRSEEKKKSLQADNCSGELWPAAVSNGWFNPSNKAQHGKVDRTLITGSRYYNYQQQSEINSAHPVQST